MYCVRDSDEKNIILEPKRCKFNFSPSIYLLCSHLFCDTFMWVWGSTYCHVMPGVLKRLPNGCLVKGVLTCLQDQTKELTFNFSKVIRYIPKSFALHRRWLVLHTLNDVKKEAPWLESPSGSRGKLATIWLHTIPSKGG